LVQVNPSEEEKRSALDQVLRSQAFARSDQLRKFLTYVCEEEIAGRAAELNEYRIGVEALGRSKRFSTGEDSTVRNRAYALRHKLEEYYAQENPDAAIRIRLPKGSYAPQFVEREHAELAPLEEQELAPEAAPLPIEYTVAPARRRLLAAFAAGALAASLAGLLLWWAAPDGRIDPTLREFWGELLARDADVLVCIATPPHLVVRQYPSDAPPISPRYTPAPAGADAAIRRYRHVPDNLDLYMLRTDNSPLWGDAIGALTVSRVLAQAGAGFRVLPERVVSFPVFRGRNVMLFGLPEYSPAAARLADRGVFRIGYSSELREQVVWRKGVDGKLTAAYAPGRKDGEQVQTYGLITALPQSEGHRRIVIFAGLSSVGAQAAAEFFSSPDHMRDLKARFRKEGHAAPPPAYQVVVESTATATLPITVTYTTHVTLP